MKLSKIKISNEALFKIAELISYTIAFNLFLFGAEVFKEFYSGSIHLAPLEYMYFGLHHKSGFVPWMWSAFAFNVIAFFIFLLPKLRENFITLNIDCKQTGVGGDNSWGAKTWDAYIINTDSYQYSFIIKPIQENK